MAEGLVTFLVGCLVLAVVLYVARIIIAKIEVDASIKQIAWLIIGLLALIAFIYLAAGAMPHGGASWGPGRF